MSSKNLTQLIEKTIFKNSLCGIWTQRELFECDSEENVFEEIFDNHLIETSKHMDWNSGNIPVYQNSIIEDNDKTDYFDSEDEYWENHTSTMEDNFYLDAYEEEYLSPSMDTRNNGRFSKGVEQYVNMPVFQKSLRKFAVDNSFEVKDVVSDGNCMFRAIADQLLINGCLGHTAESLRHTAIEYLRQYPFQEDKGHPSSFLSEEKWEEYLKRMSKSGEWSDHIILQAVADSLFLEVIVFNVYHDDIYRTEVKGKMNKHDQNRLTIFLGHLGEFHYLSLRPKLWQRHWPYKALILRILACSKGLDTKTKKHLIIEKVTSKCDERFIPETTLNGVAGFAVHSIRENETGEETLDEKSNESSGKSTMNFRSYHPVDLQLEETEESIQGLIEDEMHIDPLTGVPLTHLSFIMKILLPKTLKETYNTADGRLFCLRDDQRIFYHFRGPWCNPCYFTLRDITRSQKMQSFYNKRYRKMPKVVIIRRDKTIGHADQAFEQFSSHVYVESSDTHPGYCRLKLPKCQATCKEDYIFQTGSSIYLQAYDIPESLKSLPNFRRSEIQYVGICCPFPTCEWKERKRNYDFPSPDLVYRILQRGCTLIPKPHPKSKNPTIEWKYNFSMAKFIIMENLTETQQYGYFILKVLLENITFHLNQSLKVKHLRAVFLRSCEEMPSSAWDTCFSGCVLYVISKLISNLKTRFLPHYFIPTNNLIDCFSDNDINALCICIESLRLFPANIIQFVAEKHGHMYGANLVRIVLSDIPTFVQTMKLRATVENTFIPISIRTAKVLSRMGHYETVSQLLKDTYELLLLLPDSEANPPNFLDFIEGIIDQIDQRSSRIILAKASDRELGGNLAAKQKPEGVLLLENLIPWRIDDLISWLQIPCDKAVDFTSIANFLYEYSIAEYDKRNVTLSLSAVESAIRCLKHAVEQDFLDVSTIEDEALKAEIILQTRVLKERLNHYYMQMFFASRLELRRYPLMDYMSDIEKQCEEFPNISGMASKMFFYLKMPEKKKEYDMKYRATFQN
ncbi:uncharacterized protein LOC133204620 [Saccostrea echinata]|uniref:uncharacterized protein LOC133204620 n=1 Tax=Saccostrea echinata TaxID=191078 RepID=UPI002A82398B|nr:uncharacterized protein LOC133204620 [Saccostrea echinata]